MSNDSILRNTLDLHYDLEAVEATSFSSLEDVAESFDKVPVGDTVRCLEESKSMGSVVVEVRGRRVCACCGNVGVASARTA